MNGDDGVKVGCARAVNDVFTASLQAMPMLWGFHTALSYVPALRAVQLVA